MTDAETVGDLLQTTVKRMRRFIDDNLVEHGLSMSRTKLLGALVRNGPSQQASLAVEFGLAPRTITELVDELERDGLVERHVDPVDRRARLVCLTDAGRAAHRDAVGVKAALIEQIFGPIGPRQLGVLAAILRRLDQRVSDLMVPSRERPS